MHHQPPVLNRHAYGRTGLQVEQVKDGGGTANIIEPPTFRRFVVCIIAL